MQRTVFLALLTFLTTFMLVRFVLHAPWNAVEFPYSEFTKMLDNGTAQARIERIDLELGLTDSWGRDIAMLKIKGDKRPRYMLVPADFYHRMWQELPRKHIPACNVCFRPPMDEVAALIVSLFALRWFFRGVKSIERDAIGEALRCWDVPTEHRDARQSEP